MATRLVKAWARWPATRPTIPPDEDEDLHARRLVAQRCLYGVDKNPRAVELAKLSLWLATLARDHEFTFLDHALKCGDSLVGLDAKQITAMHWDASKPGLPLFRKFVADRVAEATKVRAEIQSAPDETRRVVLEQKHKLVEKSVDHVRVLGDAVLSAFFAEAKPRAREKRRAMIESWVSGIGEAKWDELRAAAASLRTGEHPVRPFHWAVEFPEVFARANPGFDAIVGNPPFLGGKQMPTYLGPVYCEYLKITNEDSLGAADLCAFFYRRAFDQIRSEGAFGLLATNTIAETATRKVGLDALIERGADIYRAISEFEWPGEASVTVSQVHVFRGQYGGSRFLNGRNVSSITTLLSASSNLASARKLRHGIAYSEGVKLYDGGAFIVSSDQRLTLLRSNPGLEPYLRVYVNGDVLNETPACLPQLYAIDFGEKDEAELSGCDPVLRDLKHRVAEARKKQTRQIHEHRPWLHWDKRTEFFNKARKLENVVAVTIVSRQYAFHVVDPRHLYAHGIKLFADQRIGLWGVLQSRLHETWSRAITSSLGTSLRYTTTSCFDMFPFSDDVIDDPEVARAAQDYMDARSEFLQALGIGTTNLYGNYFHQSERDGEDIVRLRELHAEMDRAVLRAYRWDDLAERAKPVFLDESNEDDHAYQGRLFWPCAFRDEVLARLLALNAERAAEERTMGLAPTAAAGDEESDEDEAA